MNGHPPGVPHPGYDAADRDSHPLCDVTSAALALRESNAQAPPDDAHQTDRTCQPCFMPATPLGFAGPCRGFPPPTAGGASRRSLAAGGSVAQRAGVSPREGSILSWAPPLQGSPPQTGAPARSPAPPADVPVARGSCLRRSRSSWPRPLMGFFPCSGRRSLAGAPPSARADPSESCSARGWSAPRGTDRPSWGSPPRRQSECPEGNSARDARLVWSLAYGFTSADSGTSSCLCLPLRLLLRR